MEPIVSAAAAVPKQMRRLFRSADEESGCVIPFTGKRKQIGMRSNRII
jgi:hypothetical protein